MNTAPTLTRPPHERSLPQRRLPRLLLPAEAYGKAGFLTAGTLSVKMQKIDVTQVTTRLDRMMKHTKLALFPAAALLLAGCAASTTVVQTKSYRYDPAVFSYTEAVQTLEELCGERGVASVSENIIINADDTATVTATCGIA